MGFVDAVYWFLACGAFFMFHYAQFGMDIAFEMFLILSILSIFVYKDDIIDCIKNYRKND